MRSRVTRTRTENPGRMVIVGWTFKERPTTCWPTWLKLWEAPWRMAWARLFSLSLVPASAPTLRTVERTAASKSEPQCSST